MLKCIAIQLGLLAVKELLVKKKLLSSILPL